MKLYFDEVIKPLNDELGQMLHTKHIQVRDESTETEAVVMRNEFVRDRIEIGFFDKPDYSKAPF